jgi:HK97 gp10 family phage protein
MIDFKIEGTENLRKNLKMLSSNVQLKTARAAGRKAANVIRQAAQENARRLDDPKTATSIAENIVVQASAKELKTTGDLYFRIGVRGGAKSKGSNKGNPGGDTFYWRFLELGTSKIPAKHFMLNAMRNNIDKATNTFIAEFDKGLNKAVNRMKKS